MKILIVDDEQLARERLKQLVSGLRTNIELSEATNGREALFSVNATNPDLVLMDIRMPVMDGLESAMHISRMQNPPPIIFINNTIFSLRELVCHRYLIFAY